MLDTNAYTDWTAPAMRAWLEQRPAAARDADWRFVSFHQPPFNSSKAHFADQLTRVLAAVFEAGKVDVVFSGHVHNYQRTYPLRFNLADEPDATDQAGRAGGRLVHPRSQSSTAEPRRDPRASSTSSPAPAARTCTTPTQQDDPDSWQEFTCKFVSQIHSLTVADVQGKTLTVRQVSADGDELDQFR